jgi:hypothetical protein
MDVNIGISDGVWTEQGGKRIWSICISVPNAQEITAEITNHSIAPNAEMYVYSPDGKEIHGPFVAKFFEFRKGMDIWAIIEKSGSMVIQIIEPADSEQTSTFEIKSVGVVLQEHTETTSLPCNSDVVCFPDYSPTLKSALRVAALFVPTNTVNFPASTRYSPLLL